MATKIRSRGAPILAGLIMLGACTTAPDAPLTSDPDVEELAPAGTTFNEFPGLLEEFRAEAALLSLPAGASWIEPVDPGPELLPNGQMGTSSYEEGYGLGMAGDQWFCVWIDEWLTQRGADPIAEADALAQMNTYPDSEAFATTIAEGSSQQYIVDLLTKASLGDPSAAARHFELNCEAMLEAKAHVETAS